MTKKTDTHHTEDPFRVNFHSRRRWKDQIIHLANPLLEHLFAFGRLNDLYSKLRNRPDHETFEACVLKNMNITYAVSDAKTLHNIPEKGPFIIIANHPFGVLDGLILMDLIYRIRQDVKFIAQKEIKYIPDIRDRLILVDTHRSPESKYMNIKAVRHGLQWLKRGGGLVLFPSGAVSQFRVRHQDITDPGWIENTARLIKLASVPLIPVYFEGRNSLTFLLAGMFNQNLRMFMYPREFLKTKNKHIIVKVGDSIQPKRYQGYTNPKDLLNYLRLKTYVLQYRPLSTEDQKQQNTLKENPLEEIPERFDRGVLTEEIESLPPGQELLKNREYSVIYAKVDDIPYSVRELGRLREITFRDVGEGTGKSLDLDIFDEYYYHLIVWNHVKKEIVGAYRLGPTDEIIRKYGTSGLYTSTLFRYKAEIFDKMGPSLELGRSFIRKEYQKKYAPLLLLWKGISLFIVRNPHYANLFGPVSITGDYNAASRQILVNFLKDHYMDKELARYVRPRNPFKHKSMKVWDKIPSQHLIKTPEELSSLISDIEHQIDGIPVLIKQYLKLGGKILSFNVDPDFNYCLDGLIYVNLPSTDRDILKWYMSPEGYESYIKFHQS
ncbi:lysophospholipid acyltransferase family protein [Fidelibacter multiformis]|jgi:putative hemolysin|uniref:lysophospholipid acyltransferase family protein n=1 Tax=Fidelibacter multiformis TaxID=3377529 RepID=UPI0037DC11C0